MPGAYAHLTLVNELTAGNILSNIDMPIGARVALSDYFGFCELGAVSPDYPYLKHGEENAKWADKMHVGMQTKRMLVSGIENIKILDGSDKEKGFSWLCGLLSHIIADVTIHPVINLKVGPYAQNKKAHRVCEMNQDAYIYKRLNLGDIGISEHLDTGIRKCSNPSNQKKLDPIIVSIFDAMLKDLDPEMYSEGEPEIDGWHEWFVNIVDNIAEEGNKLFPLARHVAVNQGLTYPDEPDMTYINALNVPLQNDTMNYDEIFDKAINNIKIGWSHVAKAIFEEDSGYLTYLGNWNLDSGENNNNEIVFWA